jgi:1-acyl-sn-glycerol-3-phosphate acyltransferase
MVAPSVLPVLREQAAEARLRTSVGARRHVVVPPRTPAVHHTVRWLFMPIFRLYFGMRGDGAEHVPPYGPFVIAPNHVSMLDWAFVSYFLRWQVRFLVDRAYWDHPRLGTWLRFNGAVPVRAGRPDPRAFRLACAVLAGGEPLIVFPEGQISRTGRPQHAQPGIVRIAAAAQAPIVPVAIRGAFEAFPRWQRLPRPGRITVAFGRPLPPPPGVTGRGAQQAQADGLMAHITALLDGREPEAPPW